MASLVQVVMIMAVVVKVMMMEVIPHSSCSQTGPGWILSLLERESERGIQGE